MNQQSQQNEGQTPFPAQPATQSGNVGPLAAAVVIVVLLAAGGFYFLYYSQQQAQTLDATQDAGADTANNSNSVDSIEADLEATQTSGAEADVENLNGAL